MQRLITQSTSYIRNLTAMAKERKYTHPNLSEILKKNIRIQRELLEILKTADVLYCDIAYYGKDNKNNFYLRVGTNIDPFFVTTLTIQKDLTDTQIEAINEMLNFEINKPKVVLDKIDFIGLIENHLKKETKKSVCL